MKEEAKNIFAVGQSVEPKKNKSFLIGRGRGMSKKYIDADALIEELNRCGFDNTDDEAANLIKDIICDFPTADVVEVVRCKDCDNWEYIGNLGLKRRGSCAEWSDAEDGMTRYTDENDFCSYWERKDG